MRDARRTRHAGAAPVLGDLLEPGGWQDEAAADWVFHLPDSPAPTRMSMDAHLLDAVATGATRRIVYVADASWYCATGARPITEDDVPDPCGPARRFLPALNRLGASSPDRRSPCSSGCVYGSGSCSSRASSS
jgi:hypothetical protein